MESNYHIVAEIERQVQYEIMQQAKIEQLQTILDELHYEGFTQSLSQKDIDFYLEQYSELL